MKSIKKKKSLQKGILLGVIPARGGSKGIKKKNIRVVLGKPLIYYTIKEALKYRELKRVIVSTDSPEIARIARQCGAEIPYLRPRYLAKDNTPMLSVLKYVLIRFEKENSLQVSGVVLFDPTSPLRDKSEIKEMIKIFYAQNPDLVVAVTRSKRSPYFNMLEMKKNGHAGLIFERGYTRRQQAPFTYDITNNCWIFSRRAILNNWRIPEKTIIFESKSHNIDIDEKRHLKLFAYFLKKHGKVTG